MLCSAFFRFCTYTEPYIPSHIHNLLTGTPILLLISMPLLLLNPRDPHRRRLPVQNIILPKELNQEVLLALNTTRKEPPQHDRIPNKANHIPQYKLRPEAPPKEPKVARMAQEPIQPLFHQHMALLMLNLDMMVEVARSLRHSQGADHLAHEHENQTQGKSCRRQDTRND